MGLLQVGLTYKLIDCENGEGSQSQSVNSIAYEATDICAVHVSHSL